MGTFAVVLVLAYSIILHEVMHGVVAYANGDPTAKIRGRLTLNPLPHMDLFGTVILPAALIFTQAPFIIGWAKPVPFDPRYFRRFRTGLVTVALAGPVTNLVLAALFAVALRSVGPNGEGAAVLYYGVALNLMLALFNLLPIPPLDGSKIFAALLPLSVQRVYFRGERWGLLAVLLLMVTGVLGAILLPFYRYALRALLG